MRDLRAAAGGEYRDLRQRRVGRLSTGRTDLLAPLALIGFCTLWRLPAIGDPPLLNDEGVYATVGRALLQGEALYRQVWENKPPGIYVLNAAIETLLGSTHVLAGMRWLALLASLSTLGALYRILIERRSRTIALLAVALAGSAIDLPLLDGTSANAEIFVAATSAIGMVLLWRGIDRTDKQHGGPAGTWWIFGVAGIALGLGMLLKLPAGADLLAALLTLAVTPFARPRRQPFAALLAGAALPLAFMAIWLTSRGLLGEAIYAMIGYNRDYVTTGQGLHAPLVSAAWLAPLALLAWGSILARRSRHMGASPFGAFSCWWAACGLIGALASGRAYPHYVLQAAAPLALCLALLVSATTSEHWPALLLRILLACWVLGVPLGSWLALQAQPRNATPGSNQPAYYAYVWQHLTGELSDTAYGNRIDPRVERNLAVARWLAAHPAAPHRLYIWGNSPWIYYLSGYEHAARFLSAYYRPAIPGGLAQTVRQLCADPPSYIVVITPPTPDYAPLGELVAARYRPAMRIQNAVMYHLVRPAATTQACLPAS